MKILTLVILLLFPSFVLGNIENKGVICVVKNQKPKHFNTIGFLFWKDAVTRYYFEIKRESVQSEYSSNEYGYYTDENFIYWGKSRLNRKSKRWW